MGGLLAGLDSDDAIETTSEAKPGLFLASHAVVSQLPRVDDFKQRVRFDDGHWG
jgi:hypothetical protein